MSGRYKPYTNRGITRVPCFRCGASSFYQWHICSLGRKWYPVCVKCDVALNKMVLLFMRVKGWRPILKRYAERA